MVCVSGKSFRHEGLECGGLSHATIADFLKQSLRVVFMHAKKKKGEERRFYSEEDVGYLASGSNEMKL